jgi:dTDP-4-dehydrorhamnose 3,5-epimerase
MTNKSGLKITPLGLPGAVSIEPTSRRDERGRFLKIFHSTSLADEGLTFELREEFYSVSHRGVLRGMHFQRPPFDHQKLVVCIAGRVLDVLVDLRQSSPTFGQSCSLELSGESPRLVWIPRGLAHGFLSLRNDSIVMYKTDCEYASEHDAGVRWDSFGFTWPMPVHDLVISSRDQQHPRLAEFVSPFCDLGAAGG